MEHLAHGAAVHNMTGGEGILPGGCVVDHSTIHLGGQDGPYWHHTSMRDLPDLVHMPDGGIIPDPNWTLSHHPPLIGQDHNIPNVTQSQPHNHQPHHYKDIPDMYKNWNRDHPGFDKTLGIMPAPVTQQFQSAIISGSIGF